MNDAIGNIKEIKEILSLPCITIESHRFGQLRICADIQKGRGSYF
jgi:hypothetical protein